MKKYLIILLTLSVSVFAEDVGSVKVTGDRVSLRAAPQMTAVLLDRAMSGDELILKDNSNPDWVGVAPPDAVNLWVHSEFIKDGAVVPPKLNVRSGPSLNHSVVGVLTNGQPVTIRKQLAEWTCIAPTVDSTVWISRNYVDVVLPESPEPVEPAEAAVEIEETAPVETVTAAPTVEQVFAAATETPDVPQVLQVNPEKEQGVEEVFSGLLQPAGGMLYKLVNQDVEEITVCYVRGNQEQMAAFAQLPLKLTGKTYWAKGMEYPIIVPERIQVLSTPASE